MSVQPKIRIFHESTFEFFFNFFYGAISTLLYPTLVEEMKCSLVIYYVVYKWYVFRIVVLCFAYILVYEVHALIKFELRDLNKTLNIYDFLTF